MSVSLSLDRKQVLADAARAISLANLFFIGAWMPLLDKSFNQRLKFTLFNLNNLFGLILDVGLLALLFWMTATAVRLAASARLTQCARLAFLFVCCLVLCLQLMSPKTWINAVGYFNITELRVIAAIGIAGCFLVVRNRWRWIFAGLAIAALFMTRDSEYGLAGLFTVFPSSLLVRAVRRLVKGASVVLLILFPFAILLLLQNLWLIYRIHEKTPAPALASDTANKRRAVWLIFDELDYHAAFGTTDRQVPLPEFDRLQNQSLVAANSYPPADSTMLSLPALITGKLVAHAKPVHSSELLLNFDHENGYVPWSAQSNVFEEARQSGFNTGMVGWYHPYKRIIGGSLNRCSVHDADAVSLPVSMLLNVNRALERTVLREKTMPLAGLLAGLSRRRHIEAYVDCLEEAKRLATEPGFGLVLIHLPVPHPPGIYNRERSEFEFEGDSSYFDNLALADRTLGEIRRAMEEAGTWDSSLVLTSSDHWWRPAIWQSLHVWTTEDNRFAPPASELDYRVPFLLKLPGQQTRISIDTRFNTVLSGDLLIAFLHGSVDDIDSVIQWINNNASDRDPYLWDQSTD